MKPDSMLVEPEFINEAFQVVVDQGPEAALDQLESQEPALASLLRDRLATLTGKVTLSGAPREVAQGVHADALVLVLACLEALRRGHYALWKDTALSQRLTQLEPKPRPRRRRKPPRDEIPLDDSEGDSPF
jgi:hypothetical protein